MDYTFQLKSIEAYMYRDP